MDNTSLQSLASLIRLFILEITHRAGSGHPTSSFSSVDLMTVLFFEYLKFDTAHPERIDNDRVIFSKGHASALFYSIYAAAGVLTEKELYTYRDFGSRLEGHPTHRFPLVEAASGSLGQGLSVGVGEALAMRMRRGLHVTPEIPRVFVLLGDGELAEGSNWEAVAYAYHQKLDNLVALVDVNRWGQSEGTMLGYNIEQMARRFEAFGWATLIIDGHDFVQIETAFDKARIHQGSPVVILAKTTKGKGIPYWEDANGWHNKMLPKEELEKAIASFASVDRAIRRIIQKPEGRLSLPLQGKRAPKGRGNLYQEGLLRPAQWRGLAMTKYSDPTPTKKAFGNALVRLGLAYPDLVVLDGDMKNSTETDRFAEAFPDRFFQCYIAEQNMMGVAVGLCKRGLKPVVSTFACFLARAYDQIRMAPLSKATIYLNGAYGGVSLGKDGPSQMGLEDFAMMRAVFGSTVLSPCDPYQTERLVEEMLKLSGVVYIRTIREPTPVIYDSEDSFAIGGSNVHDRGGAKRGGIITIVATGITVHEALNAQEQLVIEGIPVRVVDCYSIKPIDAATLKKTAGDSKALIVVEDHYPEGGLGDAVREALSDMSHPPIYHLAVRKQPMSGKPEELLRYEEIDAEAIVAKIRLI